MNVRSSAKGFDAPARRSTISRPPATLHIDAVPAVAGVDVEPRHLRTFPLSRRSISDRRVYGPRRWPSLKWFAPEALQSWCSARVDQADLMRNIGLCLAAVIVHHTLTAVLTALRLCRIVSAMNFAQSLLFAGLALAMIWRHPNMTSIVYAYGIACVVASVGALAWAWPAIGGHSERPEDRLVHSEFWAKLLRFAFFVWATNLLTHLFAIVDRYMLVHFAGLVARRSFGTGGPLSPAAESFRC